MAQMDMQGEECEASLNWIEQHTPREDTWTQVPSSWGTSYASYYQGPTQEEQDNLVG